MRASISLVSGTLGGVLLVEPAQQIEFLPLPRRRHVGARPQIDDRRVAGPEQRALIGRRAESRCAQTPAPPMGAPRAVAQHDETGQILILAAQPVGDPRAHRCAARKHVAGQRVIDGGSVIVVVHLDAVDEGQIVHARGDVREQTRTSSGPIGRAARTGKARGSRGSARRKKSRSRLRRRTASESVGRRSFSSAGLYSNRSIWLTPPSRNRKMQRLALARRNAAAWAAWDSSRAAPGAGQRARNARPAQPEVSDRVRKSRRVHMAFSRDYSTYRNSFEFSSTRATAAKRVRKRGELLQLVGLRSCGSAPARMPARCAPAGPVPRQSRSSRPGARASSFTRSPLSMESACSAVVVTLRRSQDSLNTGASKASIIGCGSDRRWKV